jgi:hypothetical protein
LAHCVFAAGRLMIETGKKGWLGKWLLVAALLGLLAAAHFGIRAMPGSQTPLTGQVRRLGVTLLLAALALGALQMLWRPVFDKPQAVKKILMGGIAVSGALLMFLLPPFQGPDESMHWKTALAHSRSRAHEEPALLLLPEQLKANDIPFCLDQKFDPRLLQAAPLAPEPAGKPPVAYATRLSYPMVTAVSLFFPRVQTTQEALVFYYCCRALPLAVLLLLLWVAIHSFEVPFLALMFCSLPLALQQFMVVSTDTALNLGTAGAALLFLRLRREWAWQPCLLLAALCLYMSACKPVVAGLLLLPLWHFPWRKLPRPRLTAPVLIVAGLAAAGAVVWFVMRQVVWSNGLPGAELREEKLALLQTGAGWRAFWSVYSAYMLDLRFARNWTSHLGWLDARLDPHHLTYIELSIPLALLLDVWQYHGRAVGVLRGRKALLAKLLAVIAAQALVMSLWISALMYVANTPLGSPLLIGMQARYLFPAMLAALLLPVLLVDGLPEPPPGPLRQKARLAAGSLAAAAIALLMLGRIVALFTDMTARYW